MKFSSGGRCGGTIGDSNDTVDEINVDGLFGASGTVLQVADPGIWNPDGRIFSGNNHNGRWIHFCLKPCVRASGNKTLLNVHLIITELANFDINRQVVHEFVVELGSRVNCKPIWLSSHDLHGAVTIGLPIITTLGAVGAIANIVTTVLEIGRVNLTKNVKEIHNIQLASAEFWVKPINDSLNFVLVSELCSGIPS